jgi:hypothetical protein
MAGFDLEQMRQTLWKLLLRLPTHNQGELDQASFMQTTAFMLDLIIGKQRDLEEKIMEKEEEKKKVKVATAYLWANGMVMAFDDKGQQISELQGPKEEVFSKLMAAIDKNTKLEGFGEHPCVWK